MATALPAPPPLTPHAPLVGFRAPPPLLAAIDRAAVLTGSCRSAAIRELVASSLVNRGLWPPVEEPPDGGS